MPSKDVLQTSITLPAGLTQEQKEIIGQRLIKAIRANTAAGKDRAGKSFPKYNKDYAAEKGSRVDLKETGDTLTDLSVISIELNNIVVGYPTGYNEADRVEGLVLGASGKKGVIGNADKARDFIGLPPDQVRLIVEKVRQEYPPETATEELQEQAARDKFIKNILQIQGINTQ